ncbi:MAG: hypothetical protein E6R03_09090 [Hyphomicrobiaceae bacterium]|nr:MAG: hypothetical protein E6R03_09090 [Hyphomicrobiaceae bacterium]
MKIFLDDLRTPPHPDESGPWVLCRSVADVLAILFAGHQIDLISLDHDLGDGVASGYNLLCLIDARIGEGAWPFDESCQQVPSFQIHSANPVGRTNMERVIRSIDRLLHRESECILRHYISGEEHQSFLTVENILGHGPLEEADPREEIVQ